MKDILIDLWVQDADFIWAKKLRKLLEEELPEIDGRPRKELLWDIGRLGISFDFSWLIFWRWIRLNRWSYLLPCGQTLPWLSLTFNDFHASAAGWPGCCSFVLVLVSLSEQTGLPHTANVAFAVALESGIAPGMVQEHHVLWLGDSFVFALMRTISQRKQELCRCHEVSWKFHERHFGWDLDDLYFDSAR